MEEDVVSAEVSASAQFPGTFEIDPMSSCWQGGKELHLPGPAYLLANPQRLQPSVCVG